MKLKVAAFWLTVDDFIVDGDGAWDELATVEIIPLWLDNVIEGSAVWVTTTSGYTWFIAKDEEVETWLG